VNDPSSFNTARLAGKSGSWDEWANDIPFVKSLAAHFLQSFGSSHVGRISLPGRGSVNFGLETVSPGDSYDWDGMRRGGDADKPLWLFQYTLSGWGLFEAAGTWRKVSAGQAFFAKIPSRHRYRSDAACMEWTFFWAIVRQPYVVARLLKQRDLVNAVATLGEKSPPIQAAASFFFQARGDDDPYAIEESLFHWMLELERWAFSRRHPAGERDRLLAFARDHVRERMGEFIPVTELAAACKMSRSNFTHHFRRVTGVAPGVFIREIRLREAVRLLGHKTLSVKEVAALTGFADANHLCKCFRAHFQVSPGMYQRLHSGA